MEWRLSLERRYNHQGALCRMGNVRLLLLSWIGAAFLPFWIGAAFLRRTGRRKIVEGQIN
jgi:hypothetical protein